MAPVTLRVVLAAGLVAAFACSTTLPDDAAGVTLDCHVRHDWCPTADEMALAIGLFADGVGPFDPFAPLTVEWWPADTAFALYTDDAGNEWATTGYAPSGDHVAVTDYQTLAHELMHAHLWRLFDDGNVNHAEPPGPWTDATTETEDEIKRVFREVFPEEAACKTP